MVVDLNQLKAACALIRAAGARGTGYLVAPKWVATCEHVAPKSARAVLEFPGGTAYGSVRAVNPSADCSLIELDKPLATPDPLPLSATVPTADEECEIYGYPVDAVRAGIRIKGTIRDPWGIDDLKAPSIHIYSDDAVASGKAEMDPDDNQVRGGLGGFSGSPVVIAGVVAGHLKRVLGKGGQAKLGRVFACPAEFVTNLLPREVRDRGVVLAGAPPILAPSEWKFAEERTEHFAGRAWLVESVLAFLESDASRLVIRGPPGAGKTAFAAFLVQASGGQRAVQADAVSPSLPRGCITAAYFCRTREIELRDCAERVAYQLAQASIPFRRVLQQVLPPGSLHRGGVTLSTFAPEECFHRGVALPLRHMLDAGEHAPVLLVDALDEAMASPSTASLPELLRNLRGAKVIVTTKPDARVLSHFEGAPQIDLVGDAPPRAPDLGVYVRARVQVRFPQDVCDVLVQRIVERVQPANFLAARHIVEGVLALSTDHSLTPEKARTLPLPAGSLPSIYRAHLNRVMTAGGADWESRIAPVLGPIAVSFEQGLTTAQLSRVASELGASLNPTAVLGTLRQLSGYLEGPLPDGPSRIYHQSFADFLTDRAENRNYFLDPVEQHRAIAQSFLKLAVDRWEPYAWKHLAQHLAASDPDFHSDELFELVSKGFLERKLEELSAPALVAADYELVFDACEKRRDPAALAKLARRRSELRLLADLVSSKDACELLIKAASPPQKFSALRRLRGAAALFENPLRRVGSLLNLYTACTSAQVNIEAAPDLLERIQELLHASPLDHERMRLQLDVVTAVVEQEPSRAEWALEVVLHNLVGFEEYGAGGLALVARAFTATGDHQRSHSLLERALRAFEDDVRARVITFRPGIVYPWRTLLDSATLPLSSDDRVWYARAVGGICEGLDPWDNALLAAPLARLHAAADDPGASERYLEVTLAVLPQVNEHLVLSVVRSVLDALAQHPDEARCQYWLRRLTNEIPPEPALPGPFRRSMSSSEMRAHVAAGRLRARRSTCVGAIDFLLEDGAIPLDSRTTTRESIAELIQSAVREGLAAAVQRLWAAASAGSDISEYVKLASLVTSALKRLGHAIAAGEIVQRLRSAGEGSTFDPTARFAVAVAELVLGDRAAATAGVVRALEDADRTNPMNRSIALKEMLEMLAATHLNEAVLPPFRWIVSRLRQDPLFLHDTSEAALAMFEGQPLSEAAALVQQGSQAIKVGRLLILATVLSALALHRWNDRSGALGALASARGLIASARDISAEVVERLAETSSTVAGVEEVEALLNISTSFPYPYDGYQFFGHFAGHLGRDWAEHVSPRLRQLISTLPAVDDTQDGRLTHLWALEALSRAVRALGRSARAEVRINLLVRLQDGIANLDDDSDSGCEVVLRAMGYLALAEQEDSNTSSALELLTKAAERYFPPYAERSRNFIRRIDSFAAAIAGLPPEPRNKLTAKILAAGGRPSLRAELIGLLAQRVTADTKNLPFLRLLGRKLPEPIDLDRDDLYCRGIAAVRLGAAFERLADEPAAEEFAGFASQTMDDLSRAGEQQFAVWVLAAAVSDFRPESPFGKSVDQEARESTFRLSSDDYRVRLLHALLKSGRRLEVQQTQWLLRNVPDDSFPEVLSTVFARTDDLAQTTMWAIRSASYGSLDRVLLTLAHAAAHTAGLGRQWPPAMKAELGEIVRVASAASSEKPPSSESLLG